MDLLLPEHLTEIAWRTDCLEDVRAMAHTSRAWWTALAKTYPRRLWNGLRERHFPGGAAKGWSYYECVWQLAKAMETALRWLEEVDDEWAHDKAQTQVKRDGAWITIHEEVECFFTGSYSPAIPKDWKRTSDYPPTTPHAFCVQFVRNHPMGRVRVVQYLAKARCDVLQFVMKWGRVGWSQERCRKAMLYIEPSSEHSSDDEDSSDNESDVYDAEASSSDSDDEIPGAPFPEHPSWIG
jgi:hypothetical protein